MTHGHEVSYYNRIQKLIELGTDMGARLIVSGHSHHHGEVRARDAVFVNPGSISLARDRSGGTFAIVTYDNGQFDVEFVYKQDIV
ncbi:MAG: metallophosphoesterase family protein, partial [Veillonella sp.]|jgi:phosphodiesterase family protein